MEVSAVQMCIRDSAGIAFLHVFYTETLGYAQGNGNLLRCAVHGIDIREIDYGRCIPQMLERYIHKVEMDAFHQQVGSNEHFLFGRVGEDGDVYKRQIPGRCPHL